MSLTIMEVLYNAQYNLCNAAIPIQIEIGKEQLNNAILALESGKSLNDIFEEADVLRKDSQHG
ncbi:hypothetical protein KQI82_12455 [Oscillibacter sp. MSJ-2]|uniref:Uncharacterized protein n=1 Tax=Dysosmobacter acutus TaxID=2841504 RepID=A0ABS6FBT7_9FIRM|nr:hypothetical protein [Dysosmobacter acutus]MBU5626525.1 hypothetical protein [Dysosmobacter acutus]MBU5627721.1 hypothetical protein [Dysosmobacter acutus]